MNDFISIIMPLYNEEKYISNCIESLLKQDYPLEKMEWIFVDGCSTDATKMIVQQFKNKYPKLIKIYDNPNKTVPYAMNIGIEHAKGKYIIRLDAHADYAVDYISKCVHYLNTTDADNVGGVAETKSKGFVGKCIAKMLSSNFGYDERLTRNQDNEMNYRIRKNGGKIYLANDILFSYYCRDSIKGITDMAVKNGMWNVITMKLCPGTMGIRHFIPFAFLLSLILMPVLSIIVKPIVYLFGAELVLYVILDVYFSLKSSDDVKMFLLLIILFPIFHITYGFGSVRGIVKLIFSKEFK